jgi:subtilisin-like proprotein convertase family protein
MTQGNRRTWLLLGALVGVFALAFAGLAGAKQKTKTFSSGTITQDIPDLGETNYDFSLQGKKYKRSKVKDVDVGVWIDHTWDPDLDISFTGPTGRTVDLSSDNGEDNDDDYGSGTPGCGGTLTRFNDEAETLISDGVAPFAGQFKPEQRLSNLDGTRVKGTWTLTVADDEFILAGDLKCAELKVKYKKKKKN